MNKSDLKEGLKVTLRDGNKGYIMGDCILFLDRTDNYSNDYNNNLTHRNSKKRDIIEIENTTSGEMKIRTEFLPLRLTIKIESIEELLDFQKVMLSGKQKELIHVETNHKINKLINTLDTRKVAEQITLGILGRRGRGKTTMPL